MTPTVVGKIGKVFHPPTLALGSSPLAWGKLLGLWPVKVTVLMVAHPCLGRGCPVAEKFGGVQVFGGRTRTAPKPPPARKPLPQPLRGQGETVQVRAAGLQPGLGGRFMAEKQTNASQSMNDRCKCFSACRYQRQALTMSRVGLVLATALAIIPDPAASRNHQLALPCRVW